MGKKIVNKLNVALSAEKWKGSPFGSGLSNRLFAGNSAES